MHLAILSGGNGWHVRDLQRAAVARGHRVTICDFRRLRGSVAASGDLLDQCDAVIVRTMPPGSLEQVVMRMDLLQRLQDRGILVVNPPRGLEICIDKFLATHRLSHAGLPVPPTVAAQTADDALEAFAALGGDVVVKPLFGSEGRGMIRVNDEEMAWRTFRTLERTGSVLYLQQFVHHPGWDLRVFVLGGKVIAAMRRFARKDWRTNVAQGGRGEVASPNEEESRLALEAASACGVIAAGVDLLPGPNGYVVLEVNAVPGWRALAPVAKVDIAGCLLDHLSTMK